MRVTIRVMGDKELAYRVAEIIKKTLNNNIEFKEYPVYKDKMNRKEVDDTKARLYAVFEI